MDPIRGLDCLTHVSLSTETQTKPSSSSSSTLSSIMDDALREFTLFTALPFEIRLKIYSFVNNSPRTVAIRYKSVIKRNNRNGNRTVRNWRNPYSNSNSRSHSYLSSHSPSPSVTPANGTSQQDSIRSGNKNNVNAAQDQPGGGGGDTGGVGSGSGWVPTGPAPPMLHVSRETRSEALKSYHLSFASLEAPATIYFNFEVDTLYFGGGSSSVGDHKGDEVQAPYHLDMFLGGDYYGCRDDAEKVRLLALDIPEELYGRRAFCWEDVRGFAGLREVLLLVREEEDEEGEEDEVRRLEGRLGGPRQTRKERLMAMYHVSLRRVWDSYVRGEGESLVAGEWKIPQIRVWNSQTGRSWGNVKLDIK